MPGDFIMKNKGEREERWYSAQSKEDSFWQRQGVLGPQMDRVSSRYGPVMKRISEGLKPDSKILDVGCGPTCPARLFTRGIKSYLDPLMNSYARTHQDIMPRDGKICAIAENIPFRDNSLDLVLCVNALDHMIDPDSVLYEIRRILKGDGVFMLGNFLHPPRIAQIRGFIERWLPFFREDAHPYSYTLKSIKRLISRYFDIREGIRVFRKDSALFPSIHREDWMFICRNRK
jgi:ubiquinone/menaquinone biosynthesis C-methylase UbiE